MVDRGKGGEGPQRIKRGIKAIEVSEDCGSRREERGEKWKDYEREFRKKCSSRNEEEKGDEGRRLKE